MILLECSVLRWISGLTPGFDFSSGRSCGFLRRKEQGEVLPELFDGAIEGVDGAVGTRDHDSTFHDGEDVGCQGFRVGVFREAVLDLVDALADGADPALEVFCDEFVCGAVFGINLQGEAAERAAVFAVGLEDAAAVTGEDAEDTFDGLVGLSEGGIDDHGSEGVEVAFEDLAEESLFALEEVIEAAGVYVGVGEEVGHAGAGEAALPEEVACGVDEAVAGGEGGGHGKKVLDRK
jgi:hypothetical protein